MKNVLISIAAIISASVAFIYIISPAGPKLENGEYQVHAGQEGKDIFSGYYKEILATWTVPYEEIDVTTSFGKVHVIKSGGKNKKNLILLHGSGSNSATWSYCIAEFGKHFNVYAIDTLGDLGKSRPVKLPENENDNATWLKETLDALGIKKTNIVGSSYGSFLGHCLINSYPEIAEKAVFTAFSYLSSPLEISSLLKMMYYTFLPSNENMEKELYWFNGGPMENKAAAENIKKMFLANAKYGRSRILNPTDVPESEVKKIKAPLLIIIGDRDPIFKLEKAKDYCNKINPSIRFEVIQGEGHLFALNKTELTNKLILEFLK
jgi:pimeloyl-ACP methyl ester carboxylesterase